MDGNPASLPANLLDITLALALAATLAGAVALVASRLARRLLHAVGQEHTMTEPLARGTIRIVRFVSFLVAFAVFAFPALDLAGVEMRVGLHSEELGRWAAVTGVRIAALLLLAFAIVRILAAVIVRAERDLAVGTGFDALERRKRAHTIAGVARRALSIVIWTTAVLIVLRELDVDITPVLTGAGIVGLAIGFGAQTLVRDVITGFFLIVEDQVRVGDVAMVNGTGGLVEQINLRTIVLRDMEGTVHVIPNGEIKTLANRTKDYSYYVVDLGVDYDADTDQIVTLVRGVGATLAAEPAFAPSILEPLEVMGVDDFKDSSVTLKFRIKTVPLKQWEVGRELRRRIKYALDREGIKLPSPRLDITVTQGSGIGDQGSPIGDQ
ncbi:MAG TPA: mechanosensitive ion channel family protein [Vicinamibacterales bacterium]|nr:mechanosensitive ion channel family protein [Vicinamibacterales bacterium]